VAGGAGGAPPPPPPGGGRGGGGSFGPPATPSSEGVGLVLLVSPTDAERLAFAAAFATLSIAVRGPSDLVPGESFTVPVSADR
jgi:hypothetical protein